MKTSWMVTTWCSDGRISAKKFETLEEAEKGVLDHIAKVMLTLDMTQPMSNNMLMLMQAIWAKDRRFAMQLFNESFAPYIQIGMTLRPW